ncbi:MAG: hypothetical protein HY719_12875 [Planctomycetes bacterium]|nr:hypothetical protein [Planctomycetota bacterium]
MLKIASVAWAVVALGVVGARAEEKKTSPTWQFKAGDTFYYETRLSQEQDQGMGGVAKETVTRITEFRVEKAEAAGAVLKSKVLKVVVKSKTPANPMMEGDEGMEMEWDSTTGEAPEALPLKFQALMVGHEITVEVTPGGEVKKVTGMAEIGKKALGILQSDMGAGADSNPMAAMQLKQAEEQVNSQFSDDGAKRELSGLFLAFPAGGIAKGQTWTRTDASPMPPVGTLEETETYKVTEPAGKVKFDISGTAKLIPAKKEEPKKEEAAPEEGNGDENANPLEEIMKHLSGGMKGTLKSYSLSGAGEFDTTAGRLVSLKKAASVNISIEVPVMGEQSMALTQEITVTLVPKPDLKAAPKEEKKAETTGAGEKKEAKDAGKVAEKKAEKKEEKGAEKKAEKKEEKGAEEESSEEGNG